MYRKSLIGGLAALWMVAVPVELDFERARIAVPSAAAAVDVDINVFFSNLEPYGSWVETPDHPYVWVPADVGPDWAPYTNGRWVNTDQYGWYFESDEPHAWATYHYGRWAEDDEIGWYWVPGTRWAPAWVSWRESDDALGWAPLPPPRRGYVVEDYYAYEEPPPRYWRFVPAERFLEPQLAFVVIAGDRDPEYWRRTRHKGAVRIENNVVINNFVNVDFVERKTKRKVDVVRLERVDDPREGFDRRRDGKTIKVFAANVEPPRADVKPKKIKEAKVAKEEQRRKGKQGEPGRAEDMARQDGKGDDKDKSPDKAGKAAAKPELQCVDPAMCPPGGSPKGDKARAADADGDKAQARDRDKGKAAVEAKPKAQDKSKAAAVAKPKGQDKGKAAAVAKPKREDKGRSAARSEPPDSAAQRARVPTGKGKPPAKKPASVASGGQDGGPPVADPGSAKKKKKGKGKGGDKCPESMRAAGTC